ncbi:hypothetical protein DFH06DRAFT_1201370 [Mycena polygramma]|nr:hypothetical protein DFH06DRAFT_1201370 [Mycena polygramma]
MSEIDDIFAKRPVASTSASVPPKKKQKAKEKAPEKSAPVASSSSKKRPAPETIIDPSSTRAPPQKKPKVDKPSIVAADKEDAERFKDSRGSGPRRKTEEGWSIYKEDELGISNDSGETPLCPFDCECCF